MGAHEYVLLRIERSGCRDPRGSSSDTLVRGSTYRLHGDTLSLNEGDGDEVFQWFSGWLTADSLLETGNSRDRAGHWARRPVHEQPPHSPIHQLATNLLHELNAAITTADILEVRAPSPDAPARVVLLYGVRNDRSFHGDLRDELFVFVRTNAQLTRIERTIAVIPSPRWLDFDLHSGSLTRDSIYISGWSKTLGERIANPLDTDSRWSFANRPGWDGLQIFRGDTAKMFAIGRWYRW